MLKNGAMLVVEMDAEEVSASSSRTSVASASGAGAGDDEYLSEED